MRMLLDKGFIRRALEGFVRIANRQELTQEQHAVLSFLRAAQTTQKLYMSYKSLHTLTHRFGHLAIVQRMIALLPPLYPTRYARRWARRLRSLGFGREDAVMISMGSFSTDKLYRGQLLGVDTIVTLDKRMFERFYNHHDEIQRMFEQMLTKLDLPFKNAKLPKLQIPDAVEKVQLGDKEASARR